jgi:hypothetical protein
MKVTDEIVRRIRESIARYEECGDMEQKERQLVEWFRALLDERQDWQLRVTTAIRNSPSYQQATRKGWELCREAAAKIANEMSNLGSDTMTAQQARMEMQWKIEQAIRDLEYPSSLQPPQKEPQ